MFGQAGERREFTQPISIVPNMTCPVLVPESCPPPIVAEMALVLRFSCQTCSSSSIRVCCANSLTVSHSFALSYDCDKPLCDGTYCLMKQILILLSVVLSFPILRAQQWRTLTNCLLELSCSATPFLKPSSVLILALRFIATTSRTYVKSTLTPGLAAQLAKRGVPEAGNRWSAPSAYGSSHRKGV